MFLLLFFFFFNNFIIAQVHNSKMEQKVLKTLTAHLYFYDVD